MAEIESKGNKNKEPISMLFSAIIFFVVAFTFVKKSDYKEALQTKHWSKTTGVIKQSQIQEGYNPGYRYSYYSTLIAYDYQVNGIDYEGKSFVLEGERLQFRSRHEAQSFLSNYPVGKTVSVYYSPLRHQDSVLKKGLSLLVWSWHIGCSGLYSFVYVPKKLGLYVTVRSYTSYYILNLK